MMNARQANRYVVAARAAANGRDGRNGSVLAPSTVAASGYVGRRHKARMTGAQRNSQGRRSEWSMSPYVWTDPKWSA